MKIPAEINNIVDSCFAANISFDLAVVINDVPFRIQSISADSALVINQYGQAIGQLDKD